jgi:hypothetical protein
MTHNFYDLLKDRHTVYCLTIAAIILEIFAVWFDANRKNKITTFVLRALILCLLAYVIYLSSGDDDYWKKDVTRLQKLDSTVDYEIDSMNYVNHEIDSSTKVMVGKNNDIASNNLKLTEDGDELASATKKLIQESKVITEHLDTVTDQEFEVTGEFNFPVDSSFGNGTKVSSIASEWNGGQYNLIELRNNRMPFFNHARFNVYVANYKFIISGKIYDLNDNLIVEIEDNKWRLNKNAASKFNYDSAGFEVFDNSGRVAINVNFRKLGNPRKSSGILLEIQGILQMDNDEVTLLVNHQTHQTLPYGTREENKKIYHIYDLHPIKPLFKYTGAKWRHVRNS